jgi:DNA repair photolyase
MYSGKQERLPYSLSRWTDLPGSQNKWDWFKSQLVAGKMRAFDPRTAVPVEWSLAHQDTLGLIFWTKNPENLIRDERLLASYPLVVHVTLTGWEEVEKGAPSLAEGLDLMRRAVDAFGPERVTWRFSPVPLVDDVLDRFERMASAISTIGIKEVYVAFLQENDLLPETRPRRSRVELLKQMSTKAHGLTVLICNEDNSLSGSYEYPKNLRSGICESGERFMEPLRHLAMVRKEVSPGNVVREGCGCALAVDPFTINETCTMGCAYCYAADKSLAPKKHNTTKHALPLVS